MEDRGDQMSEQTIAYEQQLSKSRSDLEHSQRNLVELTTTISIEGQQQQRLLDEAIALVQPFQDESHRLKTENQDLVINLNGLYELVKQVEMSDKAKTNEIQATKHFLLEVQNERDLLQLVNQNQSAMIEGSVIRIGALEAEMDAEVAAFGIQLTELKAAVIEMQETAQLVQIENADRERKLNICQEHSTWANAIKQRDLEEGIAAMQEREEHQKSALSALKAENDVLQRIGQRQEQELEENAETQISALTEIERLGERLSKTEAEHRKQNDELLEKERQLFIHQDEAKGAQDNHRYCVTMSCSKTMLNACEYTEKPFLLWNAISGK